MIKKQKLKIYYKIGHAFLLSVMVLGSVFGYFGATVSTAQAASPCVPSTWKDSGSLLLNPRTVYAEQSFTGYVGIPIPAEQADDCKQKFPTPAVYLYLYSGNGGSAMKYGDPIIVHPAWSSRTDFTGYEVAFTATTTSAMPEPKIVRGNAAGETGNYWFAYVYSDPNNTLSNGYFPAAGYKVSLLNRKDGDPTTRLVGPTDLQGDTIPQITVTTPSTTTSIDPSTLYFSALAEDNYYRTSVDSDKIYKAGSDFATGGLDAVNTKITLSPPANSPVSQITFGVDTLKYYSIGGATFENYGIQRLVGGFVSNIDKYCISNDHWYKALTVKNCAFKAGPIGANDPSAIMKNGQAFTYSMVLNIAARTSLETNVGTPEGKRYDIAIIPKLDINYTSADSGAAFVGDDKGDLNKSYLIHIDVYDTVDNLKANVGKPKPADIPANTAVTSTASNAKPGDCGSIGIACFLKTIIVWVVSLLREIIYTIFFYVVLPLMQAVLSIHTYTDTFASIIYPGWVIIRNVCNVFLILAMLIIGLATLFRVDGYNYKQLLVKVILAALFVNFSLVFGQAVLGIADTVQNQFLPSATAPLNQLGSALMVGNTTGGITNGWPANTGDTSAYSDVIFSIFQLALAIGSLIAFVGVTALLIVRMMALWILLMVSPVAWVADVLPATARYRGEWWSNFLKYAFFTPIMAFFLNLTAVISVSFQNGLLAKVMPNAFANGNNAGDLSAFIFKVAGNVLLIGFLIAAVQVAQTFGIKGADAAMGAVTKGIKSPFGAIAYGGKWVGKDLVGRYAQKRYNNATAKLAEGNVWQRTLYAALHVPETVKAFRKDSGEDLQRSKDLTSAAALSIKRKVYGFRRRGEDPLALYNEHKGKELLEERRGENTNSEEDEVVLGMQLTDEAMKGDRDAQLMLPEQLRRMFKNHNINEFVNRFGRDKFGLKGKELAYNKQNLVGLLNYIQENKGMSEHVNADLQKRLGGVAHESGDLTGAELTHTDSSGHAHVIRTKLRQNKKGFDVVGLGDYKALMDVAESHSNTDAEYEANVRDLENGKGPHYAELLQNRPAFNKKDYENAKTSQDKSYENNVNLNKKDGLTQTKQWWESLVSLQADGSVTLGSSGKHVFTHSGAGHEFVAGRDAITGRVKEFYVPLVIQQQQQLRSQLREAILDEARSKKKLLKGPELDLEVEKAEYRNLRMVYMMKFKDPVGLKTKYSLPDNAGLAAVRTEVNKLRKEIGHEVDI